MKLAFIGFGEAGYGLTKGLRQAGLREEAYFFDKLWDTPPYGDASCSRV
jgi:3-hydroxyisobutyrate dehydrogenase-like beta-hydroxyacid dehydrogenase